MAESESAKSAEQIVYDQFGQLYEEARDSGYVADIRTAINAARRAGYEAAKAQAARMAKAKRSSANVRLARDPYLVMLDTSRDIETTILSMTPEEPSDG